MRFKINKMKKLVLLCHFSLVMLILVSCKQKQANPIGEMVVKEVIENSPGANHLVGGIVRAVDCGLGGLAEGVFKEGTIRLEELHKDLSKIKTYIHNHQDDDDWLVPNWMPFTNDRKLAQQINRIEELELLILQQREQVDKMKKCWEGMNVFDSDHSAHPDESKQGHQPDTVYLHNGMQVIRFQ